LIIVTGSCNNFEPSGKNLPDKSLETVLLANRALLKSVSNANAVLDSIDYYRKITPLNLENGQEDFASRMKELTQYVKTTEARITKIERDLKISRKQTDGYLLMVLALKDEVALRDQELKHLADSASRMKAVFTSASISQ
jgi:hypothetical protein